MRIIFKILYLFIPITFCLVYSFTSTRNNETIKVPSWSISKSLFNKGNASFLINNEDERTIGLSTVIHNYSQQFRSFKSSNKQKTQINHYGLKNLNPFILDLPPPAMTINS